MCGWLKSRHHEADHLFDLNLLTATDTEIWRHAGAHNFIIVSKDLDFYDRALLSPPQVVHVSVGNCSNARLLEIMAIEWDEIERALSFGSRLIALTEENWQSLRSKGALGFQ